MAVIDILVSIPVPQLSLLATWLSLDESLGSLGKDGVDVINSLACALDSACVVLRRKEGALRPSLHLKMINTGLKKPQKSFFVIPLEINRKLATHKALVNGYDGEVLPEEGFSYVHLPTSRKLQKRTGA